MTRGRLAALIVIASAMPAAAQQPASSTAAFDFALPPSADTGKPPVRGPRVEGHPLPSRFQLRGNLDRNGAVELRARAFSW